MPLYEHTFIARPDLTNQQAQALIDTFSQLIADQGGSVIKNEYWGLRSLSYRLKKHRKGHYLHLNLDAPPAAIAELERNERIHDDVIRYLTVRVETLEEGPSAVMQARSSRDDRGRRDRGDRGERGDRPERGERFDRGERGDRFDRGERGERFERADRGERFERADRAIRE